MKIKMNKKKLIFLLSLIIIFFCLLGFVFYVDYQINTPLSVNAKEQIFVIDSGQGLKEVTQNLYEADLIRSKTWFNGYVMYKGWTAQLQAGEYVLSSVLNIRQISSKIVNGDALSNEIRVTIPEGFTLRQIDARLSSIGLISPGQLLEKPELEGYLFPDTYNFDKNDNLEDIIVTMMDNFDQKLDKDLVAEIERQGKTIDDIIIMASIIEKELPKYDEMRIISGIFWKRLSINYPLQSCATIAYILNVDKWIYSIEDTKIDSPYNTYKNIGLPPGPINNPGLLSIKAAIYPIYTDYNFFLSAPSGETIFSRTFEEHNENKYKYLK